jgi:hypothetical protein
LYARSLIAPAALSERGYNPPLSLLRFDRLARRPGARLDRAQEEVRNVVAEPDHRRLDVSARVVPAPRAVTESANALGREPLHIRDDLLSWRALTAMRGLAETGSCGRQFELGVRGEALLPRPLGAMAP